MKVIEIVVATDGSTRIETKGFQGAECQQASRLLETALGRRTGEALTAEYHEVAGAQSQISESH
ncbi:MAG: DUF2997 domain-containing protein [Planctomycetaceae bacterium]|nr:DUF2997 domain-containing protein [Planctomycetales bacterium]MCB9926453.1 DUF2997 domain-containing protein [Planctomycetaceae bacterium]